MLLFYFSAVKKHYWKASGRNPEAGAEGAWGRKKPRPGFHSGAASGRVKRLAGNALRASASAGGRAARRDLLGLDVLLSLQEVDDGARVGLERVGVGGLLAELAQVVGGLLKLRLVAGVEEREAQVEVRVHVLGVAGENLPVLLDGAVELAGVEEYLRGVGRALGLLGRVGLLRGVLAVDLERLVGARLVDLRADEAHGLGVGAERGQLVLVILGLLGRVGGDGHGVHHVERLLAGFGGFGPVLFGGVNAGRLGGLILGGHDGVEAVGPAHAQRDGLVGVERGLLAGRKPLAVGRDGRVVVLRGEGVVAGLEGAVDRLVGLGDFLVALLYLPVLALQLLALGLVLLALGGAAAPAAARRPSAAARGLKLVEGQ